MRNTFVYREVVVCGVFFHSPIYNRYFDWYGRGFGGPGDNDFSPIYMVDRIGKGFIETFIGILLLILNGGLGWYRDKKHWLATCDNAAGFDYRWIRSPIYFRRVVREARYFVGDPESPIREIRARGFNLTTEPCGGACVSERGRVYLRNGETIPLKGRHRQYHWTYETVLEKAVETGVFEIP